MAPNKDLSRLSSRRHLHLRADKAKLSDLFRVLSNRDIESQDLDFIDGIREKSTTFKRRGIIFLSILAQKYFHYVSKPLSWFGSTFEFCLNLVSHNKSFCTTLFRALQGTLEMPDEEDSSYVSFIGYLDKRVDLGRFKPRDKKYFGALCAVASKVSYENKAFIQSVVQHRWEMDFLGAYDFWNEYQQTLSTQGFMFHDKSSDPDMIFVVFRGTEPFNAEDWRTDFDLSWYEFASMGRVHGGFMKALGLQKGETWPTEIQEDDPQRPVAYYFLRQKLREIMLKKSNSRTRFILTGHSLGGALAVLFAAVLALHGEESILERLEAVYTFGQPRVGDEGFRGFMEEQLRVYGVRYYRFVYSHDIVPRLPIDDAAMMFKHFGTCLYYNCLFQGQVVEEEPLKNYFSLRAFVTKRVDALWEIVRGFLLPRIYGPEYKEGWVLTGCRLFGLLIPGFPAHGPEEYINSIHLGEADLFY
ncbi:PREDICTED: uncharacterized protein LOC109177545 isoform X2 [Ipomoea nil]|uniref:uncharacterized protein LOC109177545 isoform X2 n=1 Tax=Ipomoea nil TaxID=35883 RepID=UPI0009015707|nr:PREDICTED: uncharacterized protein LOC109177545 isoform X2 [Ipomoea nil]